MFTYKLNYVLFLLIFQGYDCVRRIEDGDPVVSDKKYVVYFLKASVSPQNYEGWICGGTIVSEWYIMTSAACVMDVPHLYAIAGYKKYVSELNIHTDECTKQMKKKIVLICTPNAYELDYQKQYKWSYIDIAVVQVESKYDFTDTTYNTVCSYTPAAININYDMKYQEPGIDAIVLGWGHREKYREELDLEDYNEKELKYAPVMLQNKEKCKREYSSYEGMPNVIDSYMICTEAAGNLNDGGLAIIEAIPDAEGCSEMQQKLRGEVCVNPLDEVPEDQRVVLMSRKLRTPANITINDASQKANNLSTNKTASKARKSFIRRKGICQNDHGGPLVTWIGAHEMVIGVASAFKINETMSCIGPYLYTSTQCNGAFLSCVTQNTRRGEACANFTQNGYKIFETNISWKDHPDGPAENEKNITTHASPENTDTNATINLKNSKEEKNMKLEYNNNSTISVNTKITDTLENTTTTQAENVDIRRPINVTNISSTNVTKSASVILTSPKSTNLKSKTFTNSTDSEHTNFISEKSLSNSSISNIENTKATILLKNATMNLRNTSTANVYKLETSTVNLIENASLARAASLVDTTPKNSTKSTNQTNTITTN